MSTLAEFHRQRAKSVRPRTASTRSARRLLERKLRPREGRWGVLPRPQRDILVRSIRPAHDRHGNVMDPFRFPKYRHPQARRLERIARRVAYEVGWRIGFTADGSMYFLSS